MKIGIMQPYFIPYIGYWQLLNAVDKYIIYDDVNFIKGGWINRNRILLNNGPKMINLQMSGASPNKLINEVEVLDSEILRRKFLKTIESGYLKAPYFESVYPLIERIINLEEKNLAKYLESSLKQICAFLSIDTEIIVSSNVKKNNNLKGQEKVIEICKALGASEYYNAIGGRELYSYDDFESHNIKLKFLKTDTIEYAQYQNEFVPNLSIIDVMMFNSVNEIKNQLAMFELL